MAWRVGRASDSVTRCSEPYARFLLGYAIANPTYILSRLKWEAPHLLPSIIEPTTKNLLLSKSYLAEFSDIVPHYLPLAAILLL